MAVRSCYYLLFLLLLSGTLLGMETKLFDLVRQGDVQNLVKEFNSQTNANLLAECKDKDGNSLLHIVPNAQIASFLLCKNVPVNATNNQQNTPILFYGIRLILILSVLQPFLIMAQILLHSTPTNKIHYMWWHLKAPNLFNDY